MAKYFQQQDLGEKGRYNLRKLSELPPQQALAGLMEDLEKTLTDFLFLEAKVEAEAEVKVKPKTKAKGKKAKAKEEAEEEAKSE